MFDFIYGYRERNIVDHVQSVAPAFQDGMRALYDSPIIGEVNSYARNFRWVKLCSTL